MKKTRVKTTTDLYKAHLRSVLESLPEMKNGDHRSYRTALMMLTDAFYCWLTRFNDPYYRNGYVNVFEHIREELYKPNVKSTKAFYKFYERDRYWIKGSKSYYYKPTEFCNKINEQFCNSDFIISFIEDRHHDELKSGKFKYNKSGVCGRYYHGIQNMRKQDRTSLLLKHSYHVQSDINSCHPTILLNEALMKKPDIDVTNLSRLVHHKDDVREEVSYYFDISISEAKKLIFMIFNTSKMVRKNQNRLSTLGEVCEDLGIEFNIVKEYQYFNDLQKELYEIRKLFNITKMSNFLMQKEAKVLRIIKAWFNKTYPKERLFGIHDAIVTTCDIDINALEDVIAQKIGYRLTLDKQYYKQEI